MTREEKAKAYDNALERARRIKNGEGDWRYSDLIEITPALTEIFPELAESEDERIRKHLIAIVELYWGKTNDPDKAKDLAYLEKQKDAFENGRQLGIMQEQARQELEWTGEKQKEQSLRDFIDDFPYSDQKEHQNKTDAPKEKSVGGDFLSSYKDKDLDEIAQDYVDGVKEYNPEPTWNLMQTAVCYGYHLAEQKPISSCDIVPYIDDKIAELQDMWREEKVAFDWDDMHEMIEDVARHFYQKDQKPAEWSEEDERMINGIRLVLESWDKAHSSIAGLPSLIPGYIDWLKSLRPQPNTVSVENATKFGNLEYERGIKDGIQSEKSRQWKPSEEQMEALKCAVEDVAKFSKRGGRQVEFENEPYYMALHSLYEQLKEMI